MLFMNLITSKHDLNSYYCTWSSQADLGALYPRRSDNPVTAMRDMLCEETVFGENGLIHQFPEIRSSLFFLFDDGWDVPYGLTDNDNGDFGSLIVNEERFPFCDGEPQERLKKLADRVRSFGWKGTGIWVCASGKGEKNGALFSPEVREAYWRERLRWSRYAGIAYWKVDWGCYCNSVEFRALLNRLKEEEYPTLIIEHAGVCGPLSGIAQNDFSAEQSGRFWDWEERPQEWGKLCGFSDVIRTYDVSPHLSVPTTLDRVQSLLRLGECMKSQTVVNGEDEQYICAALGLEIGIMRNQLKDTVGVPFHKNSTEAIRAVRWLTAFAPPYPIGVGAVRFGRYILTDSFNFHGSDCWISCYGDREIPQAAPSLIARNCYQPQVEYLSDEKPFVAVSMHPNEATSVAVLPRFSEERGMVTPPVKIRLAQRLHNPFTGVFGKMAELTLVYDGDISAKRVFAQDLAADTAEEITDVCAVDGREITVSGAVLERIGTSANTDGDNSAPGLVITLI